MTEEEHKEKCNCRVCIAKKILKQTKPSMSQMIKDTNNDHRERIALIYYDVEGNPKITSPQVGEKTECEINYCVYINDDDTESFSINDDEEIFGKLVGNFHTHPTIEDKMPQKDFTSYPSYSDICDYIEKWQKHNHNGLYFCFIGVEKGIKVYIIKNDYRYEEYKKIISEIMDITEKYFVRDGFNLKYKKECSMKKKEEINEKRKKFEVKLNEIVNSMITGHWDETSFKTDS